MCQKAPKCADFSINPGKHAPDPLTRAWHLQNSHSCILWIKTLTLTLKLVATTLSIGWNYFRCVKVCQVHNAPPHALAWLRVFCARMKIFHVLNIAPPPLHGILDAPLRFYRYSVKHLGSRSGSTFCLVWSGSNLLAKIIILRASPLVSYRILGRGYCSTSLFAENK